MGRSSTHPLAGVVRPARETTSTAHLGGSQGSLPTAVTADREQNNYERQSECLSYDSGPGKPFLGPEHMP
jgi:hypothetical protein